MGIQVIECIVSIWNRILGRKKHASKKRNKRKNLCKKSKDRVKSRKTKEASTGDSLLSQETNTEKKEPIKFLD